MAASIQPQTRSRPGRRRPNGTYAARTHILMAARPSWTLIVRTMPRVRCRLGASASAVISVECAHRARHSGKAEALSAGSLRARRNASVRSACRQPPAGRASGRRRGGVPITATWVASSPISSRCRTAVPVFTGIWASKPSPGRRSTVVPSAVIGGAVCAPALGQGGGDVRRRGRLQGVARDQRELHEGGMVGGGEGQVAAIVVGARPAVEARRSGRPDRRFSAGARTSKPAGTARLKPRASARPAMRMRSHGLSRFSSPKAWVRTLLARRPRAAANPARRAPLGRRQGAEGDGVAQGVQRRDGVLPPPAAPGR